MFHKFSILVLAAALPVLASGAVCGSQPCPPTPYCGSQVFGSLGTFNLALLDSMRVFESDIEGRVVLGGSAEINHYAIGNGLRSFALLTNGGLTYNTLAVYGGQTYYRKPYPFQGTNGTFLLYPGDTYNRAFGWEDSMLGFQEATAQLRELSLLLASGGVGTVALEGDTLTLIGNDAKDNRFYVTSEQLGAASHLKIVTPKGAAVTVNVSGKCVTLKAGLSVERVGAAMDQVLFNFFAAEQVYFTGVTSFVGTVLAPRAVVTVAGTVFSGDLKVGAISGSFNAAYNPFEGCYVLKFGDEAEAKKHCSFEIWRSTSPYQVFVSGTARVRDSNIGGRMAVGAAASFDNTWIGTQLAVDDLRLPWNGRTSTGAFLLGGFLNFSDGQINNGPTVYADETRTHVERVAWDGYHDGTLSSTGSLLSQEYRLLSLELSHLAVNGETKLLDGGILNPSTLVLTGTDKALNVFAVTAEQLLAASILVIDVPENATVVVRASGAQVDLSNYDFSYRGATRERTLFYLPEATHLHLSGLALRASVFAPQADVEFYSGRLEGHLFAKRLNGNGQLNRNPFLGCLPLK